MTSKKITTVIIMTKAKAERERLRSRQRKRQRHGQETADNDKDNDEDNEEDNGKDKHLDNGFGKRQHISQRKRQRQTTENGKDKDNG